MERVLIISYIISMILMVGFIYCVYREKCIFHLSSASFPEIQST